MNNQKSNQTTRERAKARVELRIHLINYILINVILVVINLTLTPGYIWFIWPLLGWGIGIILHVLNVFHQGIFSIKERMIEKDMKKENYLSNQSNNNRR